MDVDAGFCTEEMEIVRQLLVILPALDSVADLLVERLDADLELQRTRRALERPPLLPAPWR